MPLQRRIPKFGFKNPNRVEYKAVNLDTIQQLAEGSKEKSITVELMVANGLLVTLLTIRGSSRDAGRIRWQ